MQAISGIRNWMGQETGIPDFHEFERALRIDQERQSRIISVRYTSDNPVQAAAIVNRVVEYYVRAQAHQLQQAADAELAELNTRIAKTESTLRQAEATIQQELATADHTNTGQLSASPLRKLQRDVSETAQLYVTLLERQKQLRGQQGTTDTSVRILALAETPSRPSSADAKYFILPAIILSLIGGSVLAVTRERFDRTLRSERQVHSALGISCSALIPRLNWIHRLRPHGHLLKKPFSPYAEAFRSVWASLQFATQDQPPQIVLVSSSVRAEGRTTLATSLATYATRTLPRVLLIDLDFRNPAVASTLKLQADGSILDLIESNCPVDDIVQHVPELELDVLAMSRCSIDPVTIFADGKLQNALDELRNHYDLIVIDGPPLLGAAEASLLAPLADTVLFAVKWGVTRSDVAQNAVRELQELGWSDRTIAERVRAVVTNVNLKRHASYKYGDAVELLVRRGNKYGPTRAAPPVKENKQKPADKPDDEETTVQVAAE
jgi:Mrp family chromosome partitioning ATPase/capsular polysaccharide biosynthesis protein